MTDPSHFKLRPLVTTGLTLKFCEYIAAELGKNGRHGFGRQVRPQPMGFPEQGHEGSCPIVEMENSYRR